ncbi:LAMI_0B01794g1_1 [Lachancea mirantina]|uniref:LAMI_0B01794g1_1 n=1 Tax=Lachancea mirantina TaxID=1230905 RepID=A0A1G4ITK8_9SACH|nr:LAMI_0B01794g1_1 [Lachancea mirantina]
MPESGKTRSPLIRSISSKELRLKSGRNSFYSHEDDKNHDNRERANEVHDQLLHDLDHLFHRKLHLSESGGERGKIRSPRGSESSLEVNNDHNENDEDMEHEAVEAEQEEEDESFANVDEIDGPISPSSSAGSLKDMVRKSGNDSPSAKSKARTDSAQEKDYNMKVDQDYQKKLDERAEEISQGIFVHHPSKTTLNWTLQDFVSMREEIPDWFTAADYSCLKVCKEAFDKNHDASRYLKDGNYSSLVLEHLIKAIDDDSRNTEIFSALAYISMGFYGSTNSIENHLAAINKCNVSLAPHFQKLIHSFKVHAELCRDEDTHLGELTSLFFFSSTIVFFICNVLIKEEALELRLNAINIINENEVLSFLTEYIDCWRWKSRLCMRIRNIIILLHRLLLLQFGDGGFLKATKDYVLKKHNLEHSKASSNPSVLQISPLDYHSFREDVVARYPAFVPPESIMPESFDNPTSLSQFLEIPRPRARSTINSSLPIPNYNLATPVPSPISSPSPADSPGGKVRKSYQTNLAFPSPYPSDDEAGNDELACRMDLPDEKRDSEYIPYNIVEAAAILNKNIRCKLSTKQLWDERKLFMAQERGWAKNADNIHHEVSYEDDDCNEALVMQRTEKFYAASMPNFSSLICVLLQIMEANCSNCTVFEEDLASGRSPETFKSQLEMTRSKEITLKAASGVLFLLLKWFKLNHILKFEHMCVLLYDYQYINIATALLNKISERYSDRIFNKTIEARHSFWTECAKFSPSYETSLNAEIPPKLNVRLLTTEVYILKVLEKTISSKTQRLKELPLSIGSLFKRFYQFSNPDIYHPILKIVRELTPFKNKRWKSEHMDLISGVYLYEKLKLTDNWVTGKDITGELGDACGQEIALRALLQFYNFSHYQQCMEHFGYGKKRDDSFFAKEAEVLAGNY